MFYSSPTLVSGKLLLKYIIIIIDYVYKINKEGVTLTIQQNTIHLHTPRFLSTFTLKK